jgi:hypothetical protein
MILKLICQHCDYEMGPELPACQRCGAPSSAFILAAPEVEPGYQLYQNAWRGFAALYPQGWSAHSPKGAGVNFSSPDDDAYLELILLPPQNLMSAPQHIELALARLAPHKVELLPDPADHYARAVFEGAQWEGLLSVHLTAQGGTLAIARRRPQLPLNLEPAFQKMLASLSPIRPIPRESWSDPNEGSFRIEAPIGWQRQAAIQPAPGGVGIRQPICRFAADPSGQIFMAMEPEFRTFIHGEIPPQPPPGEGFFQKLGRMAQQFEHTMASSMGEVVCPFRGLRPALEHFFLPHWQRTLPGCRMIGFDDHGQPDSADVRLLLPGEIVRVVRLLGLPLPGAISPPRWLGGHGYLFQAPAALMPKFEPIFVGMAQSFQQSPQWRQRELGQAQQQHQMASFQQSQLDQQWMAQSQSLHQQRMNDIHHQGQAGIQAHQTMQQISDMQMQGWQTAQSSSDYVQHTSVNGVNERSDFINTGSGQVYNLSSHQNNYWDTGKDLIVGSDLQLQVPPDWQPLERWEGR